MITNEKLEQILQNNQEIHHARVEGDGYHYQVTIVSDSFIGKSAVMRQQWVYKLLKEYITGGALHAITMKTWTQAEWGEKHG